jgi:heterodisulfide reductase subunit A2
MKKGPKVSLFLCQCGTNIADTVDLDRIAKRFGAGAVVATHNLLCSPAGKKFMQDSLVGRKPDYVVVAACSPKTHEKTFQDVAHTAKINMARVQIANIREQCAWVTKGKDEATAKAIALINGAVERCVLHEDLDRRFMECRTDIVVIGGGIAGIEAALMAANAGRKVTIIEKEISIGGSVIKMEEIAPNMECAPCLLAPRISAIRDNPLITVIANAEVTDVIGFFGNFTVKARKKARYVKSSCIGCEACFEVCPVSSPSDFHLGLGTKKAISMLFPGSLPAAAVIDKKNCRHFIDGSCDACVAACPFQSIDFDDKDTAVELSAGAVIVATGSGTAPRSALPVLRGCAVPNVLTLPEFERIASSNGPYGGDIRLADGHPVNSMAVIHCAGSMTKEGVPYCSGICCMTAMKAGDLLRKKNPNATIIDIHDLLVISGPETDAFYKKQKHEGTKFVKTADLSSVTVAAKGGSLEISGVGFETFSVDMAVLATGSTPSPDMDRLCQLLNTEMSPSGFFKPDHQILHETGSSIDGVYAVGGCASPCDIPTAVTRAQAAAGDAIARLVPGRKIELEMMTSSVDEVRCAGCKICIAVCPYKAIAYDPNKKTSIINEAICRGCGTCAAACPGGAIRANHFTDGQIFAEVQGVING